MTRFFSLPIFIFHCALFLHIAAFANPLQHLKEAPNKGTNHFIRNVDFIYVINLDQRPEKYALTLNELAPYNITPYRFSAVNGWTLSSAEINDVGIKYNPATMPRNFLATTYDASIQNPPQHEIMSVPGRTYFSHCMSRGAIGINLSHLSILADAYKSKYSTVWIMEDDIQVIQNPHQISDAIKKLDKTVGKNNWDILFTDRDTKDNNGNYISCQARVYRPNWTPKNPLYYLTREQVSPDFTKIGARYGTYSFIIRRSGMRKILSFFKKYDMFLPFDMEFCLPEGINIYAVTNDIVSTIPRALSDNGGPGYEKKRS